MKVKSHLHLARHKALRLQRGSQPPVDEYLEILPHSLRAAR